MKLGRAVIRLDLIGSPNYRWGSAKLCTLGVLWNYTRTFPHHHAAATTNPT